MPAPIQPIAAPTSPIAPPELAGAKPAGGFSSVLAEAIQTVEHAGQNARSTVERFLSGENEEVHQTVLDVQKAELAFELFLQARNKVVQAYQEIMRMQL